MPIQDGKYVSPTWKNNPPPPTIEKAPVVESDIILHASDLANAIRSGVNDTL